MGFIYAGLIIHRLINMNANNLKWEAVFVMKVNKNNFQKFRHL